MTVFTKNNCQNVKRLVGNAHEYWVDSEYLQSCDDEANLEKHPDKIHNLEETSLLNIQHTVKRVVSENRGVLDGDSEVNLAFHRWNPKLKKGRYFLFFFINPFVLSLKLSELVKPVRVRLVDGNDDAMFEKPKRNSATRDVLFAINWWEAVNAQ